MRKNITVSTINTTLRIAELKSKIEATKKQLGNVDLLQRLTKLDIAATSSRMSTLRDSLQANQESLYSPFNQHCYADA